MIPYKLAKIYKGKYWNVYYSYINPDTGKFKRFQEKGSLNQIKNLKERNALAREMQKAINELLMAGFNPFEQEQKLNTGSSQPDISNLLLISALDFAYEKKLPSWTGSTPNDRRSVLKQVKISIEATGNNIAVKKIELAHIKAILTHAKESRKLTNLRYNAYRETISTLLGELIQWGALKYNPVDYLPTLPKEDTFTHEPLTIEELRRVGEHLREKFFNFYVFCKILFRTGTRPDEILSIKGAHVKNGYIELHPVIANSKKKPRIVPIDDDLQADIEYIAYQPEQFIFSKNLLPGETKLHRNRVSEIWQREVKKLLGINKTLYSLKPTGADVRLSMGNTMDDVQLTFGHSTKTMTRIYDKHNREKQLSQQRLKQIKPEF